MRRSPAGAGGACVQVSVSTETVGTAPSAPAGQLRAWQRRALTKYLATSPRDFLAVATPGAGKTTFALRVATSMDVTAKKGGKIVTSEGLTDKAAWGKPATWVDYTGPIGSETFGIAILNHPDSFRAPTTWHVRDYGLFAANPFGWHDFGQKQSGEFKLAPGESIRFGYRVILHKGATDPAELARAFRTYAHPPKVEVK